MYCIRNNTKLHNKYEGDLMDYVTVLTRTLLFYIIITNIYRFMGKREVGELGIIDLIVSILIAELAAMSIDNREENIFLSILPIILLTVIQIVMAYFSLKSNKLASIIDGYPAIIINKGKVNFKEMIRQRYNLNDLLIGLRGQKIKSIEDVDFAILENNGTLSVFSKYDKRVGEYPLPVILDGKINDDTLSKIHKSKNWLYLSLRDKNIKLEDIFYAFYSKNELYIIKREKS